MLQILQGGQATEHQNENRQENYHLEDYHSLIRLNNI